MDNTKVIDKHEEMNGVVITLKGENSVGKTSVATALMNLTLFPYFKKVKLAFADSPKKHYNNIFGTVDWDNREEKEKHRNSLIHFAETCKQIQPHVWANRVIQGIEWNMLEDRYRCMFVIDDLRFDIERKMIEKVVDNHNLKWLDCKIERFNSKTKITINNEVVDSWPNDNNAYKDMAKFIINNISHEYRTTT